MVASTERKVEVQFEPNSGCKQPLLKPLAEGSFLCSQLSISLLWSLLGKRLQLCYGSMVIVAHGRSGINNNNESRNKF